MQESINIFRRPATASHNNNVQLDNPSRQNNNPNPTLWIFGYGSLCWYPGFEYNKCVTGYIRGYSRRFWQGNTTHRGTPEKPGRVATLVEDEEGITFGCAYRITGQAALDYLKERECTLGGYVTLFTKFYPRLATECSAFSGEAFPAFLYIATPKNQFWMGDDDLPKIAKEIVTSRGPSGHNIEYLLRLAMFMREELPGADDPHLFELERLVYEYMSSENICAHAVMGTRPLQNIRRDSHEDVRLPVSFEHSSKVVEKKLRCLHI